MAFPGITSHCQYDVGLSWTSLQSDQNLRGPRVICSRRCARQQQKGWTAADVDQYLPTAPELSSNPPHVAAAIDRRAVVKVPWEFGTQGNGVPAPLIIGK